MPSSASEQRKEEKGSDRLEGAPHLEKEAPPRVRREGRKKERTRRMEHEAGALGAVCFLSIRREKKERGRFALACLRKKKRKNENAAAG